MRVLEHELKFAANRAEGSARQRVDAPALPMDRAARERDETKDRAAERGLAAAGFADQAEDLAGASVKLTPFTAVRGARPASPRG